MNEIVPPAFKVCREGAWPSRATSGATELSASRGMDPSREGLGMPSLPRPNNTGRNRTQEVGDSSPPSSIAFKPFRARRDAIV